MPAQRDGTTRPPASGGPPCANCARPAPPSSRLSNDAATASGGASWSSAAGRHAAGVLREGAGRRRRAGSTGGGAPPGDPPAGDRTLQRSRSTRRGVLHLDGAGLPDDHRPCAAEHPRLTRSLRPPERSVAPRRHRLDGCRARAPGNGLEEAVSGGEQDGAQPHPSPSPRPGSVAEGRPPGVEGASRGQCLFGFQQARLGPGIDTIHPHQGLRLRRLRPRRQLVGIVPAARDRRNYVEGHGLPASGARMTSAERARSMARGSSAEGLSWSL